MNKSRSVIVFRCVMAFVILAYVGCGRKGSPKAPEETAPSQVRFFTATPQTNGVMLSWEAPLMNAEGKELVDLEGFLVQRNMRVIGEDSDFETIHELKVLPPAQVTAEAPAPTKTPAETSQVVKYTYQDTDLQAGKVYEYVIIPYNEDDVEGVPSNLFRITFSGESSVVESL